MINRSCLALLFLLTSITSGAQAATMDAQVSLGPLQLQLLDLDSSDGVTPSISFHPTRLSTSLTAGILFFPPLSVEEANDAERFQPSLTQVSGGGVDGSATIDAQGRASGTTALAQAALRDPARTGSFTLYADLGYIEFTLTPATRLVVTAAASIDASHSPLAAGEEMNILAFSHLTLYRNFGGQQQGGETDELQLNTFGSASRLLTASFENATALEQQGVFRGIAYLGGSYVAPVPELGTAALLLAGLLMVVRQRPAFGA